MSDSEINEDFLHVDDPINGQKFVCLSFLSPENILKKKDIFILTEFLQKFLLENNKDLIKKISEEYKLDENNVTKLIKDIDYNSVNEKFLDFKYANNDILNDKFNEENDFKTNIRGIKIRGTYETKKEADIRAKILSKTDKTHNVFVGQVGYWLPWDPTQADSDKIDAEYQEKGLNELMKKYNENTEAKNQHFADMKQEKLDNAKKKNNIEDNLQKEDPWLNKIKEI
jgi:hypothetical protein